MLRQNRHILHADHWIERTQHTLDCGRHNIPTLSSVGSGSETTTMLPLYGKIYSMGEPVSLYVFFLFLISVNDRKTLNRLPFNDFIMFLAHCCVEKNVCMCMAEH